jgi:hypothetical protein
MLRITGVKFKATINLAHPATIFGLTIDGVQPLFLIKERLHILDRNLLTKIRKSNKSDADKYWIEQLNSPSVTINPIFAATEGRSKRTPTQDEFCAEYFAAESQIKQYLPQARLIPHTAKTVAASYALVEDLRNRRDRETEFLLRAVPLVTARHADKDLRKKEDQIVELAYSHSLTGGSLSLLATLSCLYESTSGTPPSTGRGVLHPKANYTEQMAHNSLSDLLALELLVVGSSLGLGNNAFISSDRRLGRFWQSLEATAGAPIDGKGRGNFRISTKLLHRIDDQGLERLKNIFSV